MSTVADNARAIVRQIAEAMLKLDRPASIAELAEATGLPQAIVARRLTSNAVNIVTPAMSWFTRANSGLWSLTGRGREELQR